MEKHKKEGKWNRFKKWGTDHLTEILMGALFIGGASAGFIIGKDHGFSNGYTKGLVEFRKDHIDISKALIDECGCEAAFKALNLVRSNPEMYEKLMKDPDAVIAKVHDLYYDSEYIKKCLNALVLER